MANKKTMKIITFITAIVTLVSFLYKLGLGIYSMSLVLIIASLSTLMVFICKILFLKNVYNTRERKKKAYLRMIIASLIYTLIFLLFVVLKVNNIDISSQKSYDGWIGSLLIGIMLVMFVLSIIKLKGALEKSDIMVTGLKEMIYISALTDFVIIENYIYGMYITYRGENQVFMYITLFFPLAMSICMLVTIVFMFIRYFKYKVTKKEKPKEEK